METCTEGPAYLSIINSIQNLLFNPVNMAPVESAKTALIYSSLIRACFTPASHSHVSTHAFE